MHQLRFYDPSLHHFDTVTVHDRQTDQQTDILMMTIQCSAHLCCTNQKIFALIS